jgi:hypothetical protein
VAGGWLEIIFWRYLFDIFLLLVLFEVMSGCFAWSKISYLILNVYWVELSFVFLILRGKGRIIALGFQV